MTGTVVSATESDIIAMTTLPPPQRTRVTTDAGTFDAIAAGPRDGQPVLFLHGFPELSTEWAHYVALFGSLGYRAVAVDQRGYSPDARPTDPKDYHLDYLAKDVVDIADSLGWNDFHLVGHDWGAAVAWVVAARYADRIKTLCAVSVPHLGAFAKALRTDPEQQKASAYMQLLRQPGKAETVLLGEDAAALRGAYVGVPDSNVEVYVEHLSQPGALTAALNWYRVDGFDGRDEKVAVPTLFIWGTKDSAVAVSGVDDTVNWTTGEYRLEKIEGARHFTPEECPEIVGPMIQAHLESH